MPSLTPGLTINPGEVVTRQTIYDILALAGLNGNVQASDLSADMITVTTQSLPPSNPPPGLVWFDQTEQLLKVWTDVLDGTGVSCWLACGPDAFDVALLAAEPIPYGAAVIPAPNLGLRAVTTPTDPGSQASMVTAAGWTALGRFYNLQFLGINQTTHPTLGPYNPYTVPSGTWFTGRIMGRAICWAPGSRGNPALDASMQQDYLTCFLSGASIMTNPSGVSMLRGAVASIGGTDWTTGNKDGGVWGISLRQVCPHHATLTQHHYGEVVLFGPRFKG